MKFLNTITICLLLSLVFVSCGDDDPIDEPEVKGLNGEWKASSFTLEAESTSTVIGIEFSSTTSGTGKNFDYTLNLDEGNFTTMGSYDMDVSVSVIGIDPIMSSQSYTDVNGSGTYTSTDDQISVDGQLFVFEVDGMSVVDMTGPVTANYVVDGDVLTISQDEEMTTSVGGTESTTKLKSVSIWNRQ